MANTASAKKRIRQNTTRRLRNKSTIRSIRTAEKKFLKAVSVHKENLLQNPTGRPLEKTKTPSPKELLRVYASKIDKAAQKGIVKSKKACRKISRLSQQLQQISST